MCVCVCECACVCVRVCVSECVCASRKGVGSGMAGKALAAPLFYFSFYVGGFNRVSLLINKKINYN